MKKIIFILLLLSSCVNSNNNKVMLNDIDFDKNLSFEQFKNKVIEYGKNSDFPDLKN